MFTKIKKKTKPLSHFIWLFLLIIITSFVTYFYEQNKKSNYKNLKKTLNNFYLQKTFAKITSKLENRYKEFHYIVKEGEKNLSVDVLIKRLRQKIERDPKNPGYLKTIRGFGYILEPD